LKRIIIVDSLPCCIETFLNMTGAVLVGHISNSSFKHCIIKL